MRVARVEIERVLGFKSVAVDVDCDLQLIAGPNNAGKSSFVRALATFFGNPTGEDLLALQPVNSYFKALGPRTLSSIKVWFDRLSTEETAAFGAAVRQDGKFWVSIRCGRGGDVSYRASRDTTADASRALYLEVINRFQFILVPSVRVVAARAGGEEQALERLLDTLEAILVRSGTARSTALQQDVKNKLEPVEVLVQDILDRSAAAIASELPFQEQTLTFKVPHARSALRGMLESVVIESTADASVSIADRGTGFQSALVLGILRYVAEQEAQGESNLMFAVEEPEAFLHPQTQRAMAKILERISSDAQVLITTHSSVVVDTFHVARICRLPLMPTGMTLDWKLPQLSATDAGRLSRYCSAANSELIFANAVIFVEGEGDKPVIERLLDKVTVSPGGHYSLGITVIDATGLDKIRYLVQLANLFGVRSWVVADKDSLLAPGGRALLEILKMRPESPDADVVKLLGQEADRTVTDLADALVAQTTLNGLLDPFGAFVLSSDLEGTLLDALGLQAFTDALGPSGTGDLDKTFVAQLLSDADGYEQCRSWMGGKGWSGREKKSGKLKPHLAPLLIERGLSSGFSEPKVVEPLEAWLKAIVDDASPTPL